MAEKDITEKVLMSYADVFADCINVLIYNGKHRVRTENLYPAPTESFYMGFVADFLNEGSFEGRSRQKILHGEALCEMMEALTNDTRFTALIGEMRKKQEKGEEIFMCEYIDMLEATGEAKGKIAGENKLASLLAKLYSLGREEDVKLAVRDSDVRSRLYQELCIDS